MCLFPTRVILHFTMWGTYPNTLLLFVSFTLPTSISINNTVRKLLNCHLWKDFGKTLLCVACNEIYKH